MKIIGVKAENRTGDDSDFVTFDLSEINFIELWRPTKSAEKVPMFHTNSGNYLFIVTLEGLYKALKDYGFTQLDSVNVVNLNNVSYVEESKFFIRACFENGSSTSISKANLFKVENKPKRTI
ncbi:MAG TPA: LytTR family transcriptional regulator DNA-binding domain-containing protein [Bacilli bacterium]